MKRLIFATNNKHKLEEVRAALDGTVEIISLAEAGLEGEIPETADTLQGNALQKAQWVWERVAENGEWRVESGYLDGVFADDTGLEVEALGGAPGVYSARYAGEHCSFDDNIDKLLAALDGQSNRKAAFRTVICLIDNLSTHFFEGRVDGQILTERHMFAERDQSGASGKYERDQSGASGKYERDQSGASGKYERDQSGASGKYRGFGYDPVFMPDRFALSFAEMPLDVKNSISHRGLAVKKLCDFLKAR